MSYGDESYADEEEQRIRRDVDASGWECRKCGYVPTDKELQRGSCRACILLSANAAILKDKKPNEALDTRYKFR